ncbi:MAG TPA: hypothetical protein VMV29_09810 [Ktedonobacterales bacterium]|nr:hypothetical protein [Ktedonobacterales bacterium]
MSDEQREVIGLPELGDSVQWMRKSFTFTGRVTRIFRTPGQPDRYQVEWFMPFAGSDGNPVNECAGDDLAVVGRSRYRQEIDALMAANARLRADNEALRLRLLHGKRRNGR